MLLSTAYLLHDAGPVLQNRSCLEMCEHAEAMKCVPFAEIASAARHPVFKKTVAELLTETQDRSEVRPYQNKPTK